MAAQKKDDGLVPLQVEVTVAGTDADATVRAYLFDSAGRVVDSALVGNDLSFRVDPKRRYRVTVGPDLSVDEHVPADAAALLRAAGAISRDVAPAYAPGTVSLRIEESLRLLWIFRCITIHGTVRKHLNPGGTPPAYAPICAGTVQVFTIDLAASLDNLSDAQVLNIGQTVLARMLGVEISDLLSFDWSDFARLSALSAGLYPLTGNALRAYLVAHRAELATFMCEVIPEWAISYQQLPDATIQPDGSFSLTYCFFVWQTPIDVYFEVVQTIDGQTREVADPDILCTTIWNYDGSQSAVITVEDPSAIACNPTQTGPGYLYVWPTAIGNVDLRQIDGLETPSGTGLLPGDTPFGGTLSLQTQFDPNLQSNGISYYRWSYRFDGDPTFTEISTPVTHRWMQETLSGGVITIHLNSVALGPNLVGSESNLYAIPDPNLPWVNINDPADRPFAYFDSTTGAPGRAGMVTLRMEMFDAAGTHVAAGNAGHGGPFSYLLPDLSATAADYTDAPGNNIDTNGDLVFRIQVDNRRCTAALGDVQASGNTADDCGMLHYTNANDTVSVAYAATQPGNFIDWSLSISRGSHGVVATAGGATSAPVGSHLDRTAAQLAGSCIQAAFATNLSALARATDGYARQSQYDAGATGAFALLHP
ncbi:hypothetical protein M6D93_04500 [Jatrophihabitans telluris]|uniref:Uncharacterized protein n=1 Tax=Jatrophihabitans telluris TaxID=2038343 RepID=A0ABY4R183_9ACTN|nr:hypothetical protein [Jatrophihabitans telluris]UQX89267.1 hypothetical protein M6D93_04500 [Jatrophihabitans telluris]